MKLYNAITDIPGIEVGQTQDGEALTGCTVILCRKGAVGGVDVRGSAPGTRETDLLNPINLVDKVHAVVLAGGSAFGLDAASGVMKYLADPYNQLPAITFWLLGSLASASPEDIWSALPFMLLGLLPLWLLRWRINLLSLDDEEARALGVETGRVRLMVIVAATLMTSAAVAISGVIGWIGLVIPHFARLLVGPDFSRLLPASILLGAAFLLAVDTLARTVAQIEIPLGVLTALVGTPLFLWQLATARRGWQ
jgi:iron complex transport system permease protein